MIRFLLALALSLASFTLFSQQILINEISAANLNGVVDGDGDREDWVELYNPGAANVNLSGWFLSDDPTKPKKWTIPTGINIAPGAYRRFFCSSKDKVVGAFIHTNFKITQTKGESVVLTRPDQTTADSYTFTIPNQGDQSYGRSPNGGPNWRIFTNPTPGAANGNNSYVSYAPDVTASQDGGFYPGSISVSLSTSAGYTIRYTTNGNEPDIASPVYVAAINVPATAVLKARAFSSNPQILPGFVLANTYFINVNHTLPVISIAGDNILNLMSGTQGRPFGSFEYYENGQLKTEAYGEFNKHGNDSWAYAQRGIDWITRDQMGYTDELKHKFFKERDRKKFQRLILKAAANDNYPAAGGAHIRDSYVHTLALRGGMDMDVRTHRSCIMYVNGQYWGVYDIREKVDDADYTSHYYDQDDLDVDYIKTWGNTWTEYGTSTDWYTLKNYILGNNMAVQANYDYVQERFNLLSLIDYVIINQHSVCKDWLNWNTSWWRGRNPDGEAKRWRYSLWDMDATFGHYINYTGIPNTGFDADPCDVELIPPTGDPQNHIDIFVALYNNPAFKAMYVNRYADLLNSSLSCEYMNALLDEMIGEIAPEMPQQCARWGGTVNAWQQNVQTLRNFINARCQILDESIADCYDVTGPFDLTVKVSPAASPNLVGVNTLTPVAYPFVGSYFGGINIDLQAKAAAGWHFDHWEVSGSAFGPDQLTAAIVMAFQTTSEVTAFFVLDGPCTEPTGLVLDSPAGATALDWVDQLTASSYLIKYRQVGAPVWQQFTTIPNSWTFDTLPGCSNYEMQIQSVCPASSSAFVDFNFNTPDKLQGFAVADAVICNSGTVVLDATVTGASYQWNDNSSAPTQSVSTGGSYWVKITNGNCVLSDTIAVTLINSTANVSPVLCPGETFLVGSEIFDEQHLSGQVVLQNMAASNCDSIVNVSVQYLGISQQNLNQKSCDPAAVGVDTVVMSSVITGCDSLVITTTTLATFSEISLSAASCNPNLVGIDTVILVNYLGCDSLVITNTIFDASAISVTQLSALNCDPAAVGVDTVLLSSFGGCDSLVITTTTLASFSQTLLTASSCNPNFIGVDTVLLSNFLGCDSLVITTTSFDVSMIPVTQLSALNCDPTAVGVDTVLLSSFGGCDSLVITTTTLAPMSQISLTASSCNPNLVGVDTVILSNVFGCDSLVITTTSFDPAAIAITQLSAQNCDPAATGVDTLILTNFAGCDSLVITTTSLAPMSQISLTASSCNPNLVGVDTVILSNVFGCDSLVITTTSFDASAIPVIQLTAQNCDPAATGVDTLILSSFAGCDSLVITTTSLAPTSQIFLTAVSCNPDLTGVDTVILSNIFGCDSLVITTTSFDPTAISITNLLTQNCDPTLVGIDTVLLNNIAGCDSLVITTTTLALTSETVLTAGSCDPAAVGIDTLILSNVFGCDSLVITDVEYTGLEIETSSQKALCFGGDDGVIRLEEVLSSALPVEVLLENQPLQIYDGAPLVWEELPAGIYTLTATNAAGCSVTKDIEVTESAPLTLDLGHTQPIQLHVGDSLLVEPTADFQIATAGWLPLNGVRCANCPATVITAEKSGTYTLTVFDPNGCSASASLTMQVEQGVRVFVPNALNLGGDGLNATLSVFAGPEVARIQSLQLFDRWGNMLFEQRGLAPNSPCSWDGTFRGKLLPPGVILWVCKVETTNGQVETMSGDITVLR